MMSIRMSSWLCTALVLCASTSTVLAQTTYPTKPVRIIVTFTTGGAADIGARVVGERLSDAWKQQVIVENRPGAGGNIGIEAVHKSPADGYTLLMISNSHAANVALYDRLPFDLTKDFAGITFVVSTPNILVAHPRVAANNLTELLKYVQANPGKLSYASCGNGTTLHLAMELLKAQTRSFIVHVPYRGCSPATVDVVGGQTDLAMLSIAPALPHIRAGRLKAIAVSNERRAAAAPNVPTVRESGDPALKDYEVEGWYGFAAPAGTPREIIAKIEADTKRILAQPEIRERLAAAGLEAITSTPDELIRALGRDIDKFRKVINYAKLKPD